jgi:NAD(P)H-nitrite reductase large subunit
MRYVIIGNGAAGNAAAESIRRLDKAGEIIILSDEPHEAYYRPLIPYLIYGGAEAGALFRDEKHKPQNVTYRLGRQVKSIKAADKVVQLSDGEALRYDRLLLATGASPVFPSIPGLDGTGVWGLRTVDDARGIAQEAKKAGKAVVIGGGRIGTKAALSLRYSGLEVTIVEMLPRIIPAQLDDEASQIFVSLLEKEGIKPLLGRTVKEVVRKEGAVCGVVLDNGQHLDTDMIVVATGVKPNLNLAEECGCELGTGIKVDNTLRTSLPDIFAAGDAVETVDLVTGESFVSGTWTNAVAMGQCAGINMAGGKQTFAGALNLHNAMELAGHPVISVGVIFPRDGEEVFSLRWGDNYKKLVFSGSRLAGVLLVGEAVFGAGVYTQLIREGREVGELRSRLVEPGFGAAHFLRLPPAEIEAYAAWS